MKPEKEKKSFYFLPHLIMIAAGLVFCVYKGVVPLDFFKPASDATRMQHAQRLVELEFKTQPLLFRNLAVGRDGAVCGEFKLAGRLARNEVFRGFVTYRGHVYIGAGNVVGQAVDVVAMASEEHTYTGLLLSKCPPRAAAQGAKQ